MALIDWDEGFESLRIEVHQLLERDGFVPSDHDDVVAAKMNLSKIYQDITAELRAIIAAAGKKSLLGPKEKTLLHWTATFAQSLQSFIDRDSRHKSNLLALSALCGLLGERSLFGRALTLRKDRVANLVQRRVTLLQEERALAQRIQTAKRLRDQYNRRYEALLVNTANREAAGSLFAVFGQHYQAAQAHPTCRGLAQLFRWVERSRQVSELPAEIMRDLAEVRLHSSSIVSPPAS